MIVSKDCMMQSSSIFQVKWGEGEEALDVTAGQYICLLYTSQDTMTKILDMIPDAIDKFTGDKDDKMTEKDVMDILDEE